MTNAETTRMAGSLGERIESAPIERSKDQIGARVLWSRIRTMKAAIPAWSVNWDTGTKTLD